MEGKGGAQERLPPPPTPLTWFSPYLCPFLTKGRESSPSGRARPKPRKGASGVEKPVQSRAEGQQEEREMNFQDIKANSAT